MSESLKQSGRHPIGHRLRQVTFFSIVILVMLAVATAYSILVELPKIHRQETRRIALQPFATLVDLNMRVSDLTEVTRLMRAYEFPKGIQRVQILSGPLVILTENFVDQMPAHSYRVYDTTPEFTLYQAQNGLLTRFFQYRYTLLKRGPGGQDLQIRVFIDESALFRNSLGYFLLVALAIFCLGGTLYLFVHAKVFQLLRPLQELDRLLEKGFRDGGVDEQIFPINEVVAGRSQEVFRVIQGFNRMYKKLSLFFKESSKTQMDKKIGQVASQVAHDIRSPLAALGMVSSQLQDLSEDKRILIRSAVQRIDDIAHKLVAQQTDDSDNEIKTQRASVQLLSSLIEPILSEKRMQYTNRHQVNLESMIDERAYGLFASVLPSEFKRVVSNIINNSYQAIETKGTISVDLQAIEDHIQIMISDTGAGMPAKVVSRAFEKGMTYGKEKGQGLGLYHAHQLIQEWKGTLEILSSPGHGTDVIITLPRALAPGWFLPHVALEPGERVVILDDDNSIHKVWEDRLVKAGLPLDNIHSFSNPDDLIDWYGQVDRKGPMTFLCDYEILDHDKTGLDVIQQLDISDLSVLVTSRYEDIDLQKKCQEMALNLLPKCLAGFVPIQWHEKSIVQGKPDGVLIDDQELIHKTWQSVARLTNKKLLCYYSIQEFYRAMPDIDPRTKLYIDSQLGPYVKGEEVAKELYKKGFKRIYLTTGHNKNQYPPMPWIVDIIGKKPPFFKQA